MYPDDIPYYTIHFICLGSIYGIYRQKRIQINNETFLVSICRVFRGLASVKPIKTGTIFIFHVLKSIFIVLTSMVDKKIFVFNISYKSSEISESDFDIFFFLGYCLQGIS